MKLNFCQLNRVKKGLNAVSKFAQLGDEEQVLRLLSAGGSLGDAVYGYALGGHVNKVNAFLETQPELIIQAAKGYARGDNAVETEKLKTSSELSVKKGLLEGYAQAANLTQINAAAQSKNNKDYMPAIVAGLAQAGHSEEVLVYATNEALQNVAITAAAQSGNTALVNALLALQNIFLDQLGSVDNCSTSRGLSAESMAPTDKPRDVEGGMICQQILMQKPLEARVTTALGHALVGYSAGRHYEHIEQLIKLNINPMLCLTAISDKESIQPSDIQALTRHISDKSLRGSLLERIQEVFESKLGKEMDDFSNDSELELLLDQALVPSEQVDVLP